MHSQSTICRRDGVTTTRSWYSQPGSPGKSTGRGGNAYKPLPESGRRCNVHHARNSRSGSCSCSKVFKLQGAKKPAEQIETKIERKGQSVKPYRGCGKTSHPAGKAMTRRDCASFCKTCDSCEIVGHYRSVCEKATKSSTSKTNDSDHDELDTDEDDEPLRSSTSFSFMTRHPVDGSGFQCDTQNPHRD